MKLIKPMTVFRCKTNAELLNKLFDKNYKGWGKSTYDYYGKRLWFVCIDGTNNNGWVNTKKGDKIFSSFNSINSKEYKHNPCQVPTRRDLGDIMIVFDKVKNQSFQFLGIYKCTVETISLNLVNRILEKVEDVFIIE